MKQYMPIKKCYILPTMVMIATFATFTLPHFRCKTLEFIQNNYIYYYRLC